MCIYLYDLVVYIKNLIIQDDWEDMKDWVRSIFTTICLYANINADTSTCDGLLCELYDDSDLEKSGITYDDFENFMLEYIV